MENRKNPALAQAFGQVLRPIRKARGLTQSELAAQAGISRAHVDWLERGQRVPTLTVVFVLARVLGVRPEEMVRETRARCWKRTKYAVRSAHEPSQKARDAA